MFPLSSIEICAGGGGQALGLERAGFAHNVLVEIDRHACNTLRSNRPNWDVREQDVAEFSAKEYQGIDLFAGGVPCPPFSKAGKQLGHRDERDLFPQALRLIEECQPKAIMLENVRGLLDSIFDDYRRNISDTLISWGYVPAWKLLQSSDFGVSQLRPRVVMVAIKKQWAHYFRWPDPLETSPLPVGDLLLDLIQASDWPHALEWQQKANKIAPTIVGGSKKHGGPDLGPTRARKAWALLGVDGSGIANGPPAAEFAGDPKLTVRMVARIQGFPDDWEFVGGKTAAYRQVGNAFPPPVAEAVARQIAHAIAEPLATYSLPLKHVKGQLQLLEKKEQATHNVKKHSTF